jgi:hypothetical protein
MNIPSGELVNWSSFYLKDPHHYRCPSCQRVPMHSPRGILDTAISCASLVDCCFCNVAWFVCRFCNPAFITNSRIAFLRHQRTAKGHAAAVLRAHNPIDDDRHLMSTCDDGALLDPDDDLDPDDKLPNKTLLVELPSAQEKMQSMFCPVELSRLKPFCLPPCPGELVYLFPAPLANDDKASSDDYAERDKASRYDAQRVV